jgi:Concanavalin A-like lectin/glucanases superfamily
MAWTFNPFTKKLDNKGKTLTALDARYLKLDCTNSPLTGDLKISDSGDTTEAVINKIITNNTFKITNDTEVALGAGSAFVANACTSYITVASAPTITGTWSIATWIKWTSSPGGNMGVIDIGSYEIAGVSDGFGFWLSSVGGKIGYRRSQIYQYWNSTADSGVWTCVVITFDGATMRCYKNAVVDATTYAESAPTATTFIRIGTRTDGCWEGYGGSMDETEIYNICLNQAQVDAYYNLGSGRKGVPIIGLKAGWHFDENTGTNAVDYSGGGFHGTLNNAAGWGAGIVAEGSTTKTADIVTSRDGALEDENGINTFGDEEGRTVIEGSGIRFNIGGVEQVNIVNGTLKPTTTNDIDLGTSSYSFKDIWIAGNYYGTIDGGGA